MTILPPQSPTVTSGVGMGDLIPLHQSETGVWVDARLLHVALSVGSRFNDWITRRLGDALATEGEDYYSDLSKTAEPGRPANQYMLSIDLAKEVAMLERTDRGKAIRKYFIDAEKRLRETVAAPLPAPALPTDPLELLTLSVQSLHQQRGQIQALESDVQRIDTQLQQQPIRANSELRSRIHAAGQALGKVHPRGWRGSWSAFKEAFGFNGAPLAAYDDLPQSRFDEAMTWLDLQTRSYSTQHGMFES